MDYDNLVDIVNQLNVLGGSGRSSFYTMVSVVSDYYSLDFNLIHVNKIEFDNDYLNIWFMNKCFKFKIIDSLDVRYNHDEPEIENKKKGFKRV